LREGLEQSPDGLHRARGVTVNPGALVGKRVPPESQTLSGQRLLVKKLKPATEMQ